MLNTHSKKLVYDSLFSDYCAKYPNENELTLLIKHVMPWMMEVIERVVAFDTKLEELSSLMNQLKSEESKEWVSIGEDLICLQHPFH